MILMIIMMRAVGPRELCPGASLSSSEDRESSCREQQLTMASLY
jgi:hypothetical protein